MIKKKKKKKKKSSVGLGDFYPISSVFSSPPVIGWYRTLFHAGQRLNRLCASGSASHNPTQILYAKIFTSDPADPVVKQRILQTPYTSQIVRFKQVEVRRRPIYPPVATEGKDPSHDFLILSESLILSISVFFQLFSVAVTECGLTAECH